MHITLSDSSVSRLQVLPASCGLLASVFSPISGRPPLQTSCRWPRARTPPEPPSLSASSPSSPGSVYFYTRVNVSSVCVLCIRVCSSSCLCVFQGYQCLLAMSRFKGISFMEDKQSLLPKSPATLSLVWHIHTHTQAWSKHLLLAFWLQWSVSLLRKMITHWSQKFSLPTDLFVVNLPLL